MSSFQIDKHAYRGAPRGVRSAWPDNVLPPSAWPESKLQTSFWQKPKARRSHGARPKQTLLERALIALAKLAKP